MSPLTDHERPLPDSVIARGADTVSTHGLNTDPNVVQDWVPAEPEWEPAEPEGAAA